MLNKKKQISLISQTIPHKHTSIIYLPEFSQKHFIQTVEKSNFFFIIFNTIFKKIKLKKFKNPSKIIKPRMNPIIRFVLTSKIFGKYFLLKNFEKKKRLICGWKKKIELVKYALCRKKIFFSTSIKRKKRSFLTTSFGLVNFIHKKKKKLAKNYSKKQLLLNFRLKTKRKKRFSLKKKIRFKLLSLLKLETIIEKKVLKR